MACLPQYRWEQFALGLARGKTQIAAFKEAGYGQDKNPSSSASKLAARPEIIARVEELLILECKAAGISRAWVLVRLRRLALKCEREEQYAVARQCYRDLGDAIGIFEKRQSIKFEWDGDLSKLSDAQLDKLQAGIEKLVLGEEGESPRLGSGDVVDVTAEAEDGEDAE